jgi:hypothetical protein
MGHCAVPASQPLYAQERRSERDGSVRVVYAARIGHCRACPLRQSCLGYGTKTKKPRRVSAVLWPVLGPPPPPPDRPLRPPSCHPIMWRDWSRCQARRTWMHRLRTQTVTITSQQVAPLAASQADGPQTRQQRAHYRMSWDQRLARNASSPLAPSVALHLFGIPAAFAASLGLESRTIS